MLRRATPRILWIGKLIRAALNEPPITIATELASMNVSRSDLVMTAQSKSAVPDIRPIIVATSIVLQPFRRVSAHARCPYYHRDIDVLSCHR